MSVLHDTCYCFDKHEKQIGQGESSANLKVPKPNSGLTDVELTVQGQ